MAAWCNGSTPAKDAEKRMGTVYNGPAEAMHGTAGQSEAQVRILVWCLASVAQLVERLSEKQEGVGSIPTGRTILWLSSCTNQARKRLLWCRTRAIG